MRIRVYIWVKRNKNHPFSVRRDVGEPIMIFIKRELLFSGTVGFHAPYLHGSRNICIVVNVSAIRGIFRPVYMPLSIECKLRFLFVCQRNLVQIKDFTTAA